MVVFPLVADHKKEVKSMNYALVEDGVVTNVIWLYPANASDFPSAVPMGDVPAGIGDTWDGEYFYRNGERVLTFVEQMEADTEDMHSALEVLGIAGDNKVGD